MLTSCVQQHVRARLPLLPLVTYHLLDSLVFVPIMLGVLFFLFEFFGDQVLAFLVLLSVWGCEIFSAVACRTVASLRLFPRVFLLTMILMEMYHMTWPFGFGYLSLLAANSVLLVCGFPHVLAAGGNAPCDLSDCSCRVCVLSRRPCSCCGTSTSCLLCAAAASVPRGHARSTCSQATLRRFGLGFT